jgi:hypothetical protein
MVSRLLNVGLEKKYEQQCASPSSLGFFDVDGFSSRAARDRSGL